MVQKEQKKAAWVPVAQVTLATLGVVLTILSATWLFGGEFAALKEGQNTQKIQDLRNSQDIREIKNLIIKATDLGIQNSTDIQILKKDIEYLRKK